MDKQKKAALIKTAQLHLMIIVYILQVLFVAMYSRPEIQPFVYVRF